MRSRVPRRPIVVLLVLVAGLSAACASARLRRQSTLELQRGDDLAAAGCHACLADALAIYERIETKNPAIRRLVDARTIRVSLLLALREKELGLAADAHLDRARARIDAAPASIAARERLELAELVPRDPSGLTREAGQAQAAVLHKASDRVSARLTRSTRASDDAELDAYLDLSLGCGGRATTPQSFNAEAVVAALPPTPLLAYRLGLCGRDLDARLRPLLDVDPRFVEVHLWLGRAAPRGSRAAFDAFSKAFAAFSSSAAIAIELADATRRRSYRTALPLYLRVVAAVPGHQDALYGAGLCQSYVKQHTEAVATFSDVLARGRWLVGDALYWRAWNRHQLKELDAAWADVEEAKKTLYNTSLYTLAGVIAYDRQQLDVARTNLEKGLELEARNCTAAWYLGLVHAGTGRWPLSAESFATASGCYRLDAETARAELVRATALEASNDTRASQIASAESTIEESVRQEALSAYNAAFGLVRADRSPDARPWLEVALRHTDVRTRADELLAYVNRK